MKLKQDFGVRALLGVLIVAPTSAALVYMTINGSDVALTALVALASGVIGYYFGQKGTA